MDKRPIQDMILIEVNNQEARSNFQLLEETEEWVREFNIRGDKYTIILNPNLEVERRVTITSPPAYE